MNLLAVSALCFPPCCCSFPSWRALLSISASNKSAHCTETADKWFFFLEKLFSCTNLFFFPHPSLWQDFRNYQYTLPVVKGLVVDMEVRKTSIKIPSNRYSEVSVSRLRDIKSHMLTGSSSDDCNSFIMSVSSTLSKTCSTLNTYVYVLYCCKELANK